jgi:hypothetical protein
MILIAAHVAIEPGIDQDKLKDKSGPRRCGHRLYAQNYWAVPPPVLSQRWHNLSRYGCAIIAEVGF